MDCENLNLSAIDRYKLHYHFNIILLEEWTVDELRHMHLSVMEEE